MPTGTSESFAKVIPLDEHMHYLVGQFSLTAVTHALVEVCYRRAAMARYNPAGWRNAAERFTAIERCNPETHV